MKNRESSPVSIVSITDEGVFLECFVHLLLEEFFILIRREDLLFSVASGDNVIDSVFEIDSQWSGHGIILCLSGTYVKCEDLTPCLPLRAFATKVSVFILFRGLPIIPATFKAIIFSLQMISKN